MSPVDEDRVKFSSKLRELLEENDLKQKDMASILQIAASTMNGYIQGTSEPDFKMLKRLADYFHVSTDYLLDRYPEGIQSEKEQELLRIFRSLSGEQQDLFLEQGKAFIRFNAKGTAISSKSATDSNKVV